LRSLQFSVILDYKREMVTTSVRYTKWLKITNFARLDIIRILQHFATKLWNITNFVMIFQAVMKFLSRLVEFKILVNWGLVHCSDINEKARWDAYLHQVCF
jgi:hypothetical protein